MKVVFLVLLFAITTNASPLLRGPIHGDFGEVTNSLPRLLTSSTGSSNGLLGGLLGTPKYTSASTQLSPAKNSPAKKDTKTTPSPVLSGKISVSIPVKNVAAVNFATPIQENVQKTSIFVKNDLGANEIPKTKIAVDNKITAKVSMTTDGLENVASNPQVVEDLTNNLVGGSTSMLDNDVLVDVKTAVNDVTSLTGGLVGKLADLVSDVTNVNGGVPNGGLIGGLGGTSSALGSLASLLQAPFLALLVIISAIIPLVLPVIANVIPAIAPIINRVFAPMSATFGKIINQIFPALIPFLTPYIPDLIPTIVRFVLYSVKVAPEILPQLIQALLGQQGTLPSVL